MRLTAIALLCFTGILVTGLARADGGCSPQERRMGDDGLAQAQAAEKAGNLAGALRLATTYGLQGCGDRELGKTVVTRVSRQLGSAAEADGKFAAAFDYFSNAGLYDDAKRVGLKQLAAQPADRDLADNLLGFMRNHEFADGVRAVQDHARGQAERLLAEEAKTHAVRTPQRELLDEARDWLRLAGDDTAAPVTARALERGEQYAKLDYAFALQQSLVYFEFAGRKDRQSAVQARARTLADKLAGGNDWAAAADLYEVAGDHKRAAELRAQRAAGAEAVEQKRQEQFKKEQDDLEKELDL